jgi:predicted dehydrogenase
MTRVALIGFGLAGRVFHAPLVTATPGLDLAAIVSSRKDEIAAAYPGVAVATADAVFADPGIDLVVVATPNESHFDLAARALASRKHVVIDKPFALNTTQARSLIELSRGRLLSVFHNRRWDGDFLTLKTLLHDGTLGDVAYMESRFDAYRPVVRDRWRERAGPATGTWYDLGAHLLDQALQLFGLPQAIYADLAARRPGALTTDYFRVLLRYETVKVVVAGDCLAPTARRFVLHGSRASFIKRGLDPQEPHLAAGLRPGDVAYGVETNPAQLVTVGGVRPMAIARGNYRAYYEGVRDALRGLLPLPVTAGEALAVMELLEAAQQSAASGREVAISPGASRVTQSVS